ncbi:MAG: ankyrin repeat domain-containing protein, partial [Acidobacteriaceae bacterium]|nr:ankyrin repeat domain-containing protein [Acidobacteriaceae bacterium]
MLRFAGTLLVCAGLLAAQDSAPDRGAENAQESSFSPRQPQSASEALHTAVRLGQLSAAQQLIAAGADVNARDAAGNTPLIEAARSGNIAIARLLLTRGAEVNAQGP